MSSSFMLTSFLMEPTLSRSPPATFTPPSVLNWSRIDSLGNPSCNFPISSTKPEPHSYPELYMADGSTNKPPKNLSPALRPLHIPFIAVSAAPATLPISSYRLYLSLVNMVFTPEPNSFHLFFISSVVFLGSFSWTNAVNLPSSVLDHPDTVSAKLLPNTASMPDAINFSMLNTS